MAKNKSILRDGYQSAVAEQLRIDGSGLLPERTEYECRNGTLFFTFETCTVIVRWDRAFVADLNGDDEPYTPARFREALRRIKQKGGGK